MNHPAAQHQRAALRRETRFQAAAAKFGRFHHAGAFFVIQEKHAVRHQIEVSLPRPQIELHEHFSAANRQTAGFRPALKNARIRREGDFLAFRRQIAPQAVEIAQRPPVRAQPGELQLRPVGLCHAKQMILRAFVLHRLRAVQVRGQRGAAKGREEPARKFHARIQPSAGLSHNFEP